MARIFHRNLISYLTSNPIHNKNETNFPCTNLCDPSCGNIEECFSGYPIPPFPPPITIIVSSTSTNLGLQISPIVLIVVIVLASVSLLVPSYAIVIRLWKRFRTGPVQDHPVEPETDQNDHEPDIDNYHPIWLISSVGLHQSVINSITIVRYKRGDGLIDGSDCSICLSEFQEGETLRLLPKCKHAFHIDCIDTWLRSHINCPVCRASIVINPGRPSLGSPRRIESNQTGNSESSDVELGIGQLGNSSRAIENGDDQNKVESDYSVTQRRSFSMDFRHGLNFQNKGAPNFIRNNSNSSSSQEIESSSSSRPLAVTVRPPSLKRSYSWSDMVFRSTRNDQDNGGRDVSP
ncbi:uncharacterized protein LOC141608298 [Silene latifolia]|uniref:uncharacterized protein LOC141608298 n=1 Tax=Silene latifolia TaxID=37657 RepID=UPI003D780D5C